MKSKRRRRRSPAWPPPAARPLTARTRRAGSAIARLVRIMDVLRSPAGCPWDRQQTHESLRAHLIEETYEAVEAIDRGQIGALPGELGDVLFQCVFHAQIAAEAGRFDLADVIDAIAAKLVRRHPHVFTPAGRPLPPRARHTRALGTSAAVKEQWERIKAGEQAAAGRPKRVLSGIPSAMPALLRANEIGRRVAAVGFDWPAAGAVVDKIDEEVRELREALGEGHPRVVEEMGDLLFSVANLARKLGVEPESCLRAANDKFTARFDLVEAGLEREGRSPQDASLEELEAAWQRVKATGRTSPPPSTAAPSSSSRQPSRRRSRARRRRRGPS
jgi:ATP diphosphatase